MFTSWQKISIQLVIYSDLLKMKSVDVHSSFRTFLNRLQAFLIVRFASIRWNPIDDCDEIFNFYEPLHFLLHGKGFQTWEYAPKFALRSYAYLIPFYLVLLPIKSAPKIVQFYLFRAFLSLICSLCELYFIRSFGRKFSTDAENLLIALHICSVAMFRSCVSFVNNSFSMYTVMLAYGFWFDDKNKLSIFAIAVSSLFGWVYSALLGLPIAIDILFKQVKIKTFTITSIMSGLAISLFMVVVDSMFYKKITFTFLNHIIYNLFTTGGGSSLYGIEPWIYYIKNLFLNFNILFPIAMASLPLLIILKRISTRQTSIYTPFLLLSTLYLWMGVLLSMPHKEDRFLFPVYPLFLISIPITIGIIQNLAEQIGSPRKFADMISNVANRVLPLAVLSIHFLLSLSRVIALHKSGYSAPVKIFSQFAASETAVTSNSSLICVGQEWYRLPGHFLIPSRFEVSFIKSDYDGQLPGKYLQDKHSTSIERHDFNDLNKEESTRYIAFTECQYFFGTLNELGKLSRQNWTIISSSPIIDSHRSGSYRSFYIPFVFERNVRYNWLHIFKKPDILNRLRLFSTDESTFESSKQSKFEIHDSIVFRKPSQSLIKCIVHNCSSLIEANDKIKNPDMAEIESLSGKARQLVKSEENCLKNRILYIQGKMEELDSTITSTNDSSEQNISMHSDVDENSSDESDDNDYEPNIEKTNDAIEAAAYDNDN
ncbi:hypothetical protein GJ496_006730 [Pomphorhynchus laevis]|nr:hypothetical protein GJ496_006730 [Pomphorhynchus laevis]